MKILVSLLLSASLLRAAVPYDTVTGSVAVASSTWSKGTKIVWTPLDTPKNINGTFIRSQPIETTVNSVGMFTVSLVGPVTWRVQVGERLTAANTWILRDVMTNYTVGDGGTYDWLALSTNSSLQTTGLTAFVRTVQGFGVSNLFSAPRVTALPSNASPVSALGKTLLGEIQEFPVSFGGGDTNTIATNANAQLNYTSNYLYGLIGGGGGISAQFATNIAEYFATNSALRASNSLVTLVGLANAYTLAVSNIAVTASNAFRVDLAAITAYVVGVSNIAYTASNSLRTDLIAAIAYTLGVSNISVTASNTFRTDVTADRAYTLAVSNIVVAASNYLFGIIGGSSSGVATNSEYVLSSSSAVGATSIVLDRAPSWLSGPSSGGNQFVAIGWFTTNCELRSIGAKSGSTVNLHGLGLIFAHAAGERIFYFNGSAYLAWFAAVGNASADDTWQLMLAQYEAGTLGIWLEGGQATYGILHGMVGPANSRISQINPKAVSGWTSTGTNDWMLQNQGGLRYAFTNSAADNTINITGGWNAPTGNATDPTNTCVVFWGTNLPSPLVVGKTYYVKRSARSATAPMLTVGLDTRTNEIVLTTAGIGFVYTEVASMNRWYGRDCLFDGQNRASNGVHIAIQQPAENYKLRFDNFPGTALWPIGQQGIFYNTEVQSSGIGIDTRQGSFMWFIGGNVENFRVGVIIGEAGNSFRDFHFEASSITNGTVFQSTNMPITYGTGIDQDPTHNSVAGNFIVDGVSITQNQDNQIGFDLGIGDYAAWGSLKNIYIGANLDSQVIAVRDNARGRRVLAYSSTNDTSTGQQFSLELPRVPSSDGISDEYGAMNVWGMAGKEFHYGSQRGNRSFIRIRVGTNDTGDLVEIQNSAHQRTAAFTPDGGFSVGLNSAPFVIGGSGTPGQVLMSQDFYGTAQWDDFTLSGFNNLTVTNQLNVGLVGNAASASFNGSSDYLTRDANFTAAADGKKGIVSVWAKAGDDGVAEIILAGNNTTTFALYKQSDNTIQLRAGDASTLYLTVTSTRSYLVASNWVHILCAWDLSAGTVQMSINDGADTGTVTASANNNITYSTLSDWAVGGSTLGGSLWNGCLYGLYFNSVATLDITSSANRRKFITTSYQAVDLGATGAGPTGTSPILYLPTWTGANAGSGGTFSLHGTVSDGCATDPLTEANMLVIQLRTNNANGIIIRDSSGNTLGKWGTNGIEIISPVFAYAAGWNGNFTVPTRDEVYDKIETISGSGEANVNGEISKTNGTVMGWVYDEAGVTNRLRSFRAGNGLVATNESTNIVAAVDTAVIARQSDLVTASNLFVKIQSGSANSLTVTGETLISTIGGTAPVFRVLDTNGNTAVEVSTNGMAGIFIGTNANGVTTLSNSPGRFSILTSNSSVSAVYHTTSGIGIATNSPRALLHIAAASGTDLKIGEFSANYIGLALFASTTPVNDYALLGGKNDVSTYINRPSSGKISFHESGANPPQMVINSGGNVGVGTTTPTGKLEIGGTTKWIYLTNTGSAFRFIPGGTLNATTTPVFSAGSTETNLITYSLPAHSLTNTGDRVRFRFVGNFAATANAKDMKVVFGSETILDTSSQIVNAGSWTIEGQIIRTGNTSQEVSAEFHGAGVTLFTTAASAVLAQTNGIATTLKMTSTAIGNGDVTNRTLVVEYFPAP